MLVELNVIEQVRNLSRTGIVRDAWQRSQPLAVHGLVYGLEDGRLRDIGLTIRRPGEVEDVLEAAMERVTAVAG